MWLFISKDLLWLICYLFSTCRLFCSSSPSLLPSFVLERYFLVYYFESLLISFTWYFPVTFLVVALGMTISVLIYNGLVGNSASLALIAYKSFTPTQASVSSPGPWRADQRKKDVQRSVECLAINQWQLIYVVVVIGTGGVLQTPQPHIGKL